MTEEQQEPAKPVVNNWLEVAIGDAAQIPVTKWMLKGILLSGAITILSGKGGSGKSLMTWLFAIIMGTGIKWGPFEAPARRRRVLILSAEDDYDEIRRRMEVLCNFMGLSRADLKGWVRVYKLPKIKLVVRPRDESEQTAVTELYAELKRVIKKWDIGLLAVDPYIKASSGLDEGSNDDMEEFQGFVRELVQEVECAVLMADHQRKGDGNARDATRGASSKIDDARIACSMALASKDEARDLKLPGEHFRYVKFGVFKSNYGEMTGDIWFKLTPQPVGNGEMRPALQHLVFAAHEGEWEHHAAFLALVEAGRKDEDHEGWPWTAATKGPKEGRLESGMVDAFGCTIKQAREWLERYETDGVISKHDWTSPQRNHQRVWRLTSPDVDDPAADAAPAGEEDDEFA